MFFAFGPNYVTFNPPSFNTPTGGVVGFGYGVKAFLYEISWFSTVNVQNPFKGFDITDCSGTQKTIGMTCTETCSDSWCHPTQKCLSLATACTSCDLTGCKACGTNKVPSTFCNTDCPANCARCSSSTVCTQCISGYFFYDKAGVVSCAGNFYLACSDSCSSCTTSPDCFKCASLIDQDVSTCRVYSIGYRLISQFFCSNY